MPGYTLNQAHTSLLADVAVACSTSTEEPVDWEALEAIKRLLHADDLSLGGYCIRPEHVWFEQCIPDTSERMVLHETPAEAAQTLFWQEFWQSSCSHPERTGDYESVTTVSDLESLAETRAWAAREGAPYEREIMACMPLSQGRHLRLLGWRGPTATGSTWRSCARTWPGPTCAGSAPTPAAGRSPRGSWAVMSMVRDGMTNLQFAHRLHLSEGTVRTHLANIFDLLQHEDPDLGRPGRLQPGQLRPHRNRSSAPTREPAPDSLAP